MSRARDRIAEGVGVGLALFVASCVVIALVSAGDERAPTTTTRALPVSAPSTRVAEPEATAPAPHATTPTTVVPARIPLRIDGECMETGLHEAEMLVKLDDAHVDPKCRVKP